MIEIHGKAGLFLEGQIHPELEGVEIVISEKGASSPLITVFTDDKGAYRYGPKEKALGRPQGASSSWRRPFAAFASPPAVSAPCTVTWSTP